MTEMLLKGCKTAKSSITIISEYPKRACFGHRMAQIKSAIRNYAKIVDKFSNWTLIWTGSLRHTNEGAKHGFIETKHDHFQSMRFHMV